MTECSDIIFNTLKTAEQIEADALYERCTIGGEFNASLATVEELSKIMMHSTKYSAFERLARLAGFQQSLVLLSSHETVSVDTLYIGVNPSTDIEIMSSGEYSASLDFVQSYAKKSLSSFASAGTFLDANPLKPDDPYEIKSSDDNPFKLNNTGIVYEIEGVESTPLFSDMWQIAENAAKIWQSEEESRRTLSFKVDPSLPVDKVSIWSDFDKSTEENYSNLLRIMKDTQKRYELTEFYPLSCLSTVPSSHSISASATALVQIENNVTVTVNNYYLNGDLIDQQNNISGKARVKTILNAIEEDEDG